MSEAVSSTTWLFKALHIMAQKVTLTIGSHVPKLSVFYFYAGTHVSGNCAKAEASSSARFVSLLISVHLHLFPGSIQTYLCQVRWSGTDEVVFFCCFFFPEE